ncbi:hypothetical protein BDN72DRAFT_865665 [Pluteus cervinus]|uniref:Uncharacterized protein n=1 Tax=Pluteus cervinus TaxID=181527 RepID=A0ACD2ZZB4_9AGAR|nr:hypothetical protein BDN72DRAFT_865665 [Pluteus cervinus]
MNMETWSEVVAELRDWGDPLLLVTTSGIPIPSLCDPLSPEERGRRSVTKGGDVRCQFLRYGLENWRMQGLQWTEDVRNDSGVLGLVVVVESSELKKLKGVKSGQNRNSPMRFHVHGWPQSGTTECAPQKATNRRKFGRIVDGAILEWIRRDPTRKHRQWWDQDSKSEGGENACVAVQPVDSLPTLDAIRQRRRDTMVRGERADRRTRNNDRKFNLRLNIGEFRPSTSALSSRFRLVLPLPPVLTNHTVSVLGRMARARA